MFVKKSNYYNLRTGRGLHEQQTDQHRNDILRHVFHVGTNTHLSKWSETRIIKQALPPRQRKMVEAAKIHSTNNFKTGKGSHKQIKVFARQITDVMGPLSTSMYSLILYAFSYIAKGPSTYSCVFLFLYICMSAIYYILLLFHKNEHLHYHLISFLHLKSCRWVVWKQLCIKGLLH